MDRQSDPSSVETVAVVSRRLDWKTWHAPSALASLLLLFVILLTAFWRSLGSQGLFGPDAKEAG